MAAAPAAAPVATSEQVTLPKKILNKVAKILKDKGVAKLKYVEYARKFEKNVWLKCHAKSFQELEASYISKFKTAIQGKCADEIQAIFSELS